MARMIIWLVVAATMLLFSHRQVGLAARPQAARGALAVTQEQQKELSLTVYNHNLGLVKDTREIRMGIGAHEVRFMDVASQIQPATVHLKPLASPRGMEILEQNYEYDLLNPQKLLEKYVGKKVKILDKNYMVRTN